MMARTRVFVSSTYYDLKHVRASLELFIESLGFDAVLSEKGDVPYASNRPLDASCYKEVGNSDIFILIIGGRYGSPASDEKKRDHEFFEAYDSITKKEYMAAAQLGIPIYVFIERPVHSEYRTFLKNRENEEINYAHADSVNIYKLIDYILSQSQNNAAESFDRVSDIEAWLREQWSGTFRELLKQGSEQQQLAAMSVQIADLNTIVSTLKTYIESLMNKTPREESKRIIENESHNEKIRMVRDRIIASPRLKKILQLSHIELDLFVDCFVRARSFAELVVEIRKATGSNEPPAILGELLHSSPLAIRILGEARKLIGEPFSDFNRIESQALAIDESRRAMGRTGSDTAAPPSPGGAEG